MADPRRLTVAPPATAAGPAAGEQATASADPQRTAIPQRYALREKDGTQFLECDEAPRLRAVIDPKMSVSRSVAASLGERVILLDGAGDFGPLIDNDRKLYNLDHHAACERLFTLSTCEQALLMVQSGLDLAEGDWTLYANEPDLDTVLALWCLLNYRRVRELRPEARDVLMPLFRLEGAIDANGPELASLCGLSISLLETTQRRIDFLLARERALKETGSWAGKNVYTYALEMLSAVDALVYATEDFGDHTRVEEIYGHVEVAPRRVAVACRDRAGIYTVEQHLKTRWGDQLSLIALENQPGHYTLRRVSSIAGPALGPAYELLNRVDPSVDGRPPTKRWGGSADIGGSPRSAGTGLAADEILDALERAYRPIGWWQRTRATGSALLVGLLCLLAWPVASFFPSVTSGLALGPGVGAAYRVALAALLVLTVGMVATRYASHRRPWVFGWRAPANGGGWWLAPVALSAALPAQVWLSPWLTAGVWERVAVVAAATLAIAAGELWFRGLVHGLLVHDFPVQRPLGPFRLSRAGFASAASYAVVATIFATSALETLLFTRLGLSLLELAGCTLAITFVGGLALAAVRERTLSLLPGIAIQLAGIFVATAGLAFAR